MELFKAIKNKSNHLLYAFEFLYQNESDLYVEIDENGLTINIAKKDGKSYITLFASKDKFDEYVYKSSEKLNVVFKVYVAKFLKKIKNKDKITISIFDDRLDITSEDRNGCKYVYVSELIRIDDEKVNVIDEKYEGSGFSINKTNLNFICRNCINCKYLTVIKYDDNIVFDFEELIYKKSLVIGKGKELGKHICAHGFNPDIFRYCVKLGMFSSDIRIFLERNKPLMLVSESNFCVINVYVFKNE